MTAKDKLVTWAKKDGFQVYDKEIQITLLKPTDVGGFILVDINKDGYVAFKTDSHSEKQGFVVSFEMSSLLLNCMIELRVKEVASNMPDFTAMLNEIRAEYTDGDFTEKGEELYAKFESELKRVAEPVLVNGVHERLLPNPEEVGVDGDDIILLHNRYETILLEDVIDMILEFDCLVFSTESTIKIYEYMIKNNIKSYQQDW